MAKVTEGRVKYLYWSTKDSFRHKEGEEEGKEEDKSKKKSCRVSRRCPHQVLLEEWSVTMEVFFQNSHVHEGMKVKLTRREHSEAPTMPTGDALGGTSRRLIQQRCTTCRWERGEQATVCKVLFTWNTWLDLDGYRSTKEKRGMMSAILIFSTPAAAAWEEISLIRSDPVNT